MRAVFFIYLMLTAISYGVGALLAHSGVTPGIWNDAPKFWPVIIPAFGMIMTIPIIIIRRATIRQNLTSPVIAKSEIRLAVALLLGPFLALLLQIYIGLDHFGLSTKERMLKGLAVLDFSYFLVMGNYMSTLPVNSKGGFRTPWTMRSQSVWIKTHRFLGRSLTAISAAALLILFIGPAFIIMSVHIAALIILKIITVVLSAYLWHRQMHMTRYTPDEGNHR